MSVREYVSQMILDGKSLLEVANELSRKPDVIKRLLLLQVGEQELRLSDILFSIPHERRNTYELIISKFAKRNSRHQSAIGRNLDPNELDLYLISRDAPRGDLYVAIADLEISLHFKIKEALVSVLGEGEEGWWRNGVPTEIRQRCAAMREADPCLIDHPYQCTTIIDLWKIIEEQWRIFTLILPSSLAADKRSLGEKMRRLNGLRNFVMHPVKAREFKKEDLTFVLDLREEFKPTRWRKVTCEV